MGYLPHQPPVCGCSPGARLVGAAPSLPRPLHAAEPVMLTGTLCALPGHRGWQSS